MTIYLDNASTSFPRSPAVGPAIADFIADTDANPGRGGHKLASKAGRLLDELRLTLTRLVGGGDPQRLIFALNATDALHLALQGSLQHLDQPHVVTTELEHNSTSRPLQMMADAGRITLTRVACDEHGRVEPAHVSAAVTQGTALIVLTHASNVVGTIQDAAAFGEIARQADALLLVDAAQTLGLVPIDVEAMGIDLLAFPGHKALLGPTGTGGLYVGPRAAERLEPVRAGGTGGDSATPHQPRNWPHRMEAGTPNTAGLAGLAAAVKNLDLITMQQRLEHEKSLTRRLRERLLNLPGLTWHGPAAPTDAVATAALSLRGQDPQDVAAILDDSFDIATRAGLHCAPHLHRRLGTFPAGCLRISPGPFNTTDDMDACAAALRDIAIG